MAISSGRKKPNAYDECDFLCEECNEIESLWFKKFIDGLNPWVFGCESWKKFNDLSSKTVIDRIPVFQPYWLDSDEHKES